MTKNICEYENFIFDLDGTLYFQKPVRIRMARRLLTYFGLRPWRIKELLIIRKYRKLHARGDYDAQQIYYVEHKDIVDTWLVKKPLPCIMRFADRELCKFICEYSDNKKMIVYSDYPVADKLVTLGLSDVLHKAYYAADEDIKCFKPNTKGLQYIIKDLNLDIKKTLFIGDRESHDGKCACGVGMDYLILGKTQRERRKQWIVE